jgi:hypothetical protein
MCVIITFVQYSERERKVSLDQCVFPILIARVTTDEKIALILDNRVEDYRFHE